MNAIALYEKLFYVFAGMAALSLALSVFLFIRFDIPQIYAMLSGKARRKTIQEIEDRNVRTGKLRQHPKGYVDGRSGHTGHTARKRHSGNHTGPTGLTGNTGQPARNTTSRREERRTKSTPRPAPAERLETEVLSTPAMQTVMLSKPTGITEELGPTEMLKPAVDTNFYFQVTENTISIHTDEFI